MNKKQNIEKYAINLAKTVDILRNELSEIVKEANTLFEDSITIRTCMKQGIATETDLLNYILSILHFTNAIMNRNKISDISYLVSAIQYIKVLNEEDQDEL